MNAIAAVEFQPLIALPWLVGLAVLVALALALALWRRAPGSLWRVLALVLPLLALVNPQLVTEQRHLLPDVVLVMVDDSPSQLLGQRPAQTATILADVQQKLAGLSNVEVLVRHESGGLDGTKLFQATQAALAELPKRRLAAVLWITDGRVHDHLTGLFGAPLHVLLTGHPQERDRRVTIAKAPGFALVGRDAALVVRVDDSGADGAADLTIRVDGQPFISTMVAVNRDVTISVPIRHAGQVVVELASSAPDGDLLAANNRTALSIPAVRDRLKVLLISGEPHAGERVWRNLLKSDPAVDLVHFTILRPPEKDDRTPIRELALITFPVRELFEEKLKDFDLVVFDRYRHRGIMAAAYYEDLSQYVRGGGGLLIAVGPEYAEPNSIAQSALGEILPTHPDGKLLQIPFVPTLTAVGQRHPVTAGLPDVGAWGPWLRQISVVQNRGQSLLTGAEGKPLLVLDEIGKGRVAQVLSDTIWLWARGYQGGGPHDELLRRLAHWLMHEPDLEAQSLHAEIQGGELTITRRSLDTGPAQAQITGPDGSTRIVDLVDQGDGRWIAAMPAPQPGLWNVSADGRTAMAAQGSLNTPELANVTATADTVAPAVEKTGGSVRFVATDGLADIRRVAAGTSTAGPSWLGLVRRDDYVIKGVRQTPFLAPLVLLLVVVIALLLAWRREGR